MSEKYYFVRTCYRDDAGKLVSPSSAANGFIWPEEIGSVVSAPDWDPSPKCGGGLHGLRPGDQFPGLWYKEPNAVWMICSYDPETAVDLSGSIKVPTCVVEYVVDFKDDAPSKITSWLKERGEVVPIYHSHITLGDFGYATVGQHGCATVGMGGYAGAGDHGTASAGVDGFAIVGGDGTATVGHNGIAVAGVHGKATGEQCFLAYAGHGGTAKAYTIAIVGHGGTAIAGPHGHAIAGYYGKAQAGYGGKIQIEWAKGHSLATNVGYLATSVGYIGENGLEPDTLYKIEGEGTFVKVGSNDR